MLHTVRLTADITQPPIRCNISSRTCTPVYAIVPTLLNDSIRTSRRRRRVDSLKRRASRVCSISIVAVEFLAEFSSVSLGCRVWFKRILSIFIYCSGGLILYNNRLGKCSQYNALTRKGFTRARTHTHTHTQVYKTVE